MNPNRPARLNRALLAVVGLVLVAAGLVVLGAGTGLLAALLADPAPAASVALAPAAALPVPTQLPDWVPWVGAAAAVVIGLLALRWLLAQTLRRPPGTHWQLAENASSGTTGIDSLTAAQPLADEIADYPGVRDATARLVGPRRQPRLYLRVAADDRTDVSDLRHRLDADAVPRLVQALDLPALPVELLLRLDGHDQPSRSVR